MGSIDKNDQMRLHGGGFSAKGHFKKWYKRVYLAILDTMLLNAYFAWNESVDDDGRMKLKRHDFYLYISERLMNYKNVALIPERLSFQSPKNSFDPQCDRKLHIPVAAAPNVRCVVCRLEQKWIPGLTGKGITRGVARCACCKITAHPYVPAVLHQIHKLPKFKGLSCFEIVHSKEGREIWKQSKTKFKVDRKHKLAVQVMNLATEEGVLATEEGVSDQPDSEDSDDDNDDGDYEDSEEGRFI